MKKLRLALGRFAYEAAKTISFYAFRIHRTANEAALVLEDFAHDDDADALVVWRSRNANAPIIDAIFVEYPNPPKYLAP